MDWNPYLNAVIRERNAMAVQDPLVDLVAEVCKELVRLDNAIRSLQANAPASPASSPSKQEGESPEPLTTTPSEQRASAQDFRFIPFTEPGSVPTGGFSIGTHPIPPKPSSSPTKSGETPAEASSPGPAREAACEHPDRSVLHWGYGEYRCLACDGFVEKVWRWVSRDAGEGRR